MPPATSATTAPRGEGGFLRDREIYPDASRDADSAFAECRKPTSCDRLPVHRSESPTGYSSAGCSPAEPLPLHRSPSTVAQSRSAEAIKSLLNRTAGMQSRSRSSCPPPTRVSSLLCAPGDISILRRHLTVATSGTSMRPPSLLPGSRTQPIASVNMQIPGRRRRPEARTLS